MHVGILSARFRCVSSHYWSAIKYKLLESTLLLGIDLSAHACVQAAICSSWCGFTACPLSTPPAYLSHIQKQTQTHKLLVAEGAHSLSL